MFKNGILCGGMFRRIAPHQGRVLCGDSSGYHHGRNLGEECCVTPRQTLIMWTKNSAYLCYDDDKMSFVEVGNFADLLLINYEFLTDTPKISRLQRANG